MNAKQLLAKLDYIVSVPGAVDKLKEMLLFLAVTGAIVSSDSNEDARPLLESIRKQKVVHPEQKKVVPSQRELLPHEIQAPKHWAPCRIGDLVLTLIGGGTPSKSNPAYWGGGISWASVKDLKGQKVLKKTEDHITREGLLNSSTNLIPPGRVILSTRMGIGKIAISGIEIAINQDLKALELPNEVDADFFCILYRTRIIEGTGTTVSGIKQNQLLALPAVLPPIVEQKRIVAKVDELMALCNRLEAQQKERIELRKLTRMINLDALISSQSTAELRLHWRRLENSFSILFNDPSSALELASTIRDLAIRGFLTERGSGSADELLAAAHEEQLRLIEQGRISKLKGLLPVTKVPYALPNNWRWARLHQVAEVIDPNPSHRMPLYVPRGIPFISTENLMDNDQIDFSIAKQVSEEVLTEHIERYEIRDGSFVFSRIGTIGKTCHLPKQRTYCISHVLVVISALTQEIDEGYLRLAVSSEGTIKQAREGVKSIGVPDLGMSKIRNFLIPIPPKEEQVRIVNKVNRLIKFCKKLEIDTIDSKLLASKLTNSYVSSITGIQVEDKEKMKNPKTELVSTLRIGVSPANSERAPLVAILIRSNGEMPAKTLWQASGLEIDAFYQQLKTEMARGWIVQPEVAYVREAEAS